MLNYTANSWFFSGTLAICALAGTAALSDRPALAQTGPHACHLLTSAKDVPIGFGAAYNLFSAAKELLLNVECGSSSNATLTMGNGQNTTYIFRTGYEWTGTQWRPISFTGETLAANNWYVGTAKANLLRSQTQLAQDNFVVAHICLWQNNSWKCGCRDTSCTQDYWQLQAFRKQASRNGEDDGIIPSATRTVNASSSSQLSSAISNAQPGDHIILADGSYSGFTISRSGQIDVPIVIRAANKLRAKVTGNITVTGNNIWIVGIDTTGRITIDGDRTRISSSRFRTNNGSSIVISSHGNHAVIDHNEIDSQAKCDSRSWIGVRLGSSHDDYNPWIYRNYFHGAPPLCSGGDDNSAIHIGGGSSRSAHKVGAVVEYNLFENWLGDDEIISNKSSSNTYQFNTAVGGKEFVNRHGENNTWNANWLAGNTGIRIHDRGHTIFGNVAPQIRVYGGSLTREEFLALTSGTGYPTGENILLVGNASKLVLGNNPNGTFELPSSDIIVEAHTGTITTDNVVGESISIVQETSHRITNAFELTPSQVGPSAPTAPRF